MRQSTDLETHTCYDVKYLNLLLLAGSLRLQKALRATREHLKK